MGQRVLQGRAQKFRPGAVLGNEEILERLLQYIILNLAAGGNWPGSPDENTPFPSQYLVDWVRVYQQ